MVSVLNSRYFSRCVCHCGLNEHFSVDYWSWAYLHVLTYNPYIQQQALRAKVRHNVYLTTLWHSFSYSWPHKSRVTCQPWSLIVCFLCPILFPKGFVCVLLSFCVSCYALKNPQIGKAVEKCFLSSVCSALSGPSNPALTSYSQMKDLLIQTTPPSPREEICHSFCVMPFDLSFSERNHVLSAFYLVVVRVRPGPWISTLSSCLLFRNLEDNAFSHKLFPTNPAPPHPENSGPHRIQGMSECSYVSLLFLVPHPGNPLTFSAQKAPPKTEAPSLLKINCKEFRKRGYSMGVLIRRKQQAHPIHFRILNPWSFIFIPKAFFYGFISKASWIVHLSKSLFSFSLLLFPLDYLSE